MKRGQIEQILGHPLPKLFAVSQNLDGLETVLSVAIQEGELRGRRFAHEELNSSIHAGCNKVSAGN